MVPTSLASRRIWPTAGTLRRDGDDGILSLYACFLASTQRKPPCRHGALAVILVHEEGD